MSRLAVVYYVCFFIGNLYAFIVEFVEHAYWLFSMFVLNNRPAGAFYHWDGKFWFVIWI